MATKKMHSILILRNATHAIQATRYFALICPGSFRMISGFPLWRRIGPVIATVLPLRVSTLENLVTSREKMTGITELRVTELRLGITVTRYYFPKLISVISELR